MIPNEKLLAVSDKSAGFLVSFQNIYDVLYDAFAESRKLHKPGFVNVDFADVRTVLHRAATLSSGPESPVEKDALPKLRRGNFQPAS